VRHLFDSRETVSRGTGLRVIRLLTRATFAQGICEAASGCRGRQIETAAISFSLRHASRALRADRRCKNPEISGTWIQQTPSTRETERDALKGRPLPMRAERDALKGRALQSAARRLLQCTAASHPSFSLPPQWTLWILCGRGCGDRAQWFETRLHNGRFEATGLDGPW